MSLYSNYIADETLEKKGVVVDYGKFRVKLARAGGFNKKYQRCLDAKAKPHKRAIQTDTMPEDQMSDILAEVYSEVVILDWQVKKADKWVTGLDIDKDGKIQTFNKKNVLELLKRAPDLFRMIREDASSIAIFRQMEKEEDSKN